MNLVQKFPTAVNVSGEVCKVNTDFRVGLKIIQAFEDPRLTNMERQGILIALLFPNQPKDFYGAVSTGIKFLDCGKPKRESTTGRVFSFTKDADFIYSAFLQTYGVDLQTADLHWWKFVNMFSDLSPETTFERIVSLRIRRNNGKLTKDEQIIWVEAREVLELDEVEDDAELLAARENFERLLRG